MCLMWRVRRCVWPFACPSLPCVDGSTCRAFVLCVCLCVCSRYGAGFPLVHVSVEDACRQQTPQLEEGEVYYSHSHSHSHSHTQAHHAHTLPPTLILNCIFNACLPSPPSHPVPVFSTALGVGDWGGGRGDCDRWCRSPTRVSATHTRIHTRTRTHAPLPPCPYPATQTHTGRPWRRWACVIRPLPPTPLSPITTTTRHRARARVLVTSQTSFSSS